MVLNVFIFEVSHEECDVTQFNQLNLNSSFSIWLLFIWLICWFMWKQWWRVGLLYNIEVIEDTVRHHEEFSNVFSSIVLLVIMIKAEFSPVNCTLSSHYLVNFPCQMPSYEFKNHLRNIKYFILKDIVIHVLIFGICSSLIFVTVQQSGMPSALYRLWEMATVKSLQSNFPRAESTRRPSFEWLTRFIPRKRSHHFQVLISYPALL